MACMEHYCIYCKHTEFNNKCGMECPWCGRMMRSFFDEEYTDTKEEGADEEQ